MATMVKALVLSNKQLSQEMYEMEFKAPNMAVQCSPGQFVHIITGSAYDPLLRRPISLYDVNKDTGIISLLYKVVGRGTELMTKIGINDYVDVMGPLGRGFSIEKACRKTLLVGGGVGMAPLVYLARELQRSQNEITVVYGCNSHNEAVAAGKLQSLGAKLLLTTMDGSSGLQGLPTPANLAGYIKPADIDFIYTCGPEAMMAGWIEFARQNGIRGEVSLEEHMACGVGACLGCARKLKKTDANYVKVCKDGPVFQIELVDLE